LAFAGCGGKELVSLSASVNEGRLTLERAALGTALTGSFELVLTLGSEAPSETLASLAGISLVRGGGELRSSVDAVARPAFPIALEPGASTSVSFAIDEAELLPEAEAEELCSGPLQWVVIVTDSLSDGKTTTTRSAAFSPSCMP